MRIKDTKVVVAYALDNAALWPACRCNEPILAFLTSLMIVAEAQ